jgi:crotonobetainyl-CoA:carnitine CoA-transferase CaiB-like acyl-CoA transferase
VPEVMKMPQLAAREMFVPVHHHTLGTLPLVNTPVKLSRTPGGIRGSSPDMGADSRDVLRDELGLDDSALDDLVARQVVWVERPEVELG